MEKYVLKNPDSFNLEHIFECGQCFRWNKIDDQKYIGVINNAVVQVQKSGNDFIFTGEFLNETKDNNKKGINFKKLITYYFDLETDYSKYKEKLSKVDSYLSESIKFGDGIRILNQDLWETIISFIISANNNIPRIKKIIERLSENYGNEIIFEGKKYYTFPTPEALSKASVKDLRNMGLGFRDERVFNTNKKILSKEIDLERIKKLDNTNEMREELLRLDGVGPKVADCILLFSLKRLDVFPIDVWIRRVMNDLYIHNENEEKVSKNEIQKLAEEKFLGLEGIAQQYLYYWSREELNNT